MNLGAAVVLVAVLAAVSFWLAQRRALLAVSGDASSLHSLPGHYGWYAALWCGVPGLLVVLVAAPWALDQLTLSAIPDGAAGQSDAEVALFLNDVKNLAKGSIASSRHWGRPALAIEPRGPRPGYGATPVMPTSPRDLALPTLSDVKNLAYTTYPPGLNITAFSASVHSTSR